MEKFKEILVRIVETIVISSNDSDETKAIKISWYTFFGSIILLFVFSWAIFVMLTFNNGKEKVPNVENENLYLGLRKLADKNLVPDVTFKFTEEHEQNIIFKQSPKAGSTKKRGEKVYLYVSLGSKDYALPDFTGYTKFGVIEALTEKFGNEIPFEIAQPIYTFDDKIIRGQVIKQDPEPNSHINSVKELKLWISNGPEDVNAATVANYIGQNIEDVTKSLSNLELYYSYHYIETANRNQNMLIESQSVSEGELVSEIMQENRVVELNVYRYTNKTNKKVESTEIVDLPAKPFSYKVDVKNKNSKGKETLIFSRETKGGFSLPIYYNKTVDNTIIVYIDGKQFKEIKLTAVEVED